MQGGIVKEEKKNRGEAMAGRGKEWTVKGGK